MAGSKSSAHNFNSSGTPQSRQRKFALGKSGRLIWLWLAMGGIAMLSAASGAFLAVSLSSKPLMQAKLSPEEAAVFGQGAPISGQGLQFSELTRPVNILVLGMSVLPQDVTNPPAETQNLSYQPQLNSFAGLSDVMLLFRFNPETKELVMLSIPRDTRTLVEGHGIEKINAANVDGGPALTAKTVSKLLGGVGIDRYVRINILGVSQLIDALGGVTVFVPKNMKYTDETQHLYVNLKAGKQHLNGDQALQLLRFRHDELGDIGRIQRQQVVLRALMDQTLNPTTLTRLPQILSVIQSHIDTNLTVEELVALAGFGMRTNRANMGMLMLPGRFSEKREYDTSYWLPDSAHIASMIAKHFQVASNQNLQPTIDPANVKVAIQDSTGRSKAVRTVVRSLQAAGYHNVAVAKPWSEPLEITHIVAQQGDSDSAEAIRSALGFGEVRIESTGNLESDVTIKIGQDWLEREEQSTTKSNRVKSG